MWKYIPKLYLKAKQKIFSYKYPALDEYTHEYIEYLENLFTRAGNAGGFDYLCTILRVEGITSENWDAFVEAEEASRDISEILRKGYGKKMIKRKTRLGLFLYCHLTEMSAPYEILANLMRCCQNKSYKFYPFSDLVQIIKNKNNPFHTKRKLPSPIKKIKNLKELASACGEEKIGKIFDSFFRNNIRNAFYHSDYTLTNKEFRIIEGSDLGKETITLEELSEYLARCFAFYSAFFIVYNRVRKSLASGKKYYRWPNYEVLELLSNNDELTGFKLHFPTGTYSMFERTKERGTNGFNFTLQEEGVQFFVGELSKYEQATDWFVNGKPFEELGTRYNTYGYWRPVVFRGNSERIKQLARKATDDKDAEGCLFYIYATGHKAIEFVLKTNKPINKNKSIKFPFFKKNKKIETELCQEISNENLYIYDGTLFLNGQEENDVLSGIKEIDNYMEQLKKNGFEIKYRLKYKMYSDLSEYSEKGEGGVITISLRMDDPRSTLVTNNLGMFPKTDWKIKKEWI